MTVAVIIAGLVPIMWGSGTGSEVMRRIAAPVTGSTPLLGMTYPNYRLFLLGAATILLVAIWLFFTKTRAGVVVRAAVQDAEMLDALGIETEAWRAVQNHISQSPDAFSSESK